MKLAAGALFLVLPFAAFAGEPRICGLSSGDSLKTYQDSVDEITGEVSSVIATGLDDLYSFPDVRNLIAAVNPEKICVSAVAVDKNIYQYDVLLISLEMQDPTGKTWVTPMVFQTSSVQAHDNTGPKPWVGFKRADFSSLVRDAISGAAFQDGAMASGFSPLPLLNAIFGVPDASTHIDASSPSYVHVPDVDPEWSTYLVTRMRYLDTGNIFTSAYIADLGVVQVNEKTGRVRFANLSDAFDLREKMIALQSAAEPSSDSADAHLTALKSLSAGP